MERIIESNVDKKTLMEYEGKSKILSEKNRALFTEVIQLRKELESKDNDLEKAQLKASQLEKQMVFVKKQNQ